MLNPKETVSYWEYYLAVYQGFRRDKEPESVNIKEIFCTGTNMDYTAGFQEVLVNML